MERELILQELDEENGTEWFKQNFYDEVGVRFDRWRQQAAQVQENGTTTYTLDNIQVEITPENPFYTVYETIKTEK